MGNQKKNVFLIIGIIIGLLILGIGIFLFLSQNKQEPVQNEIVTPEVITEISAEDIKVLKEDYLGYFANLAIAANDQMIDQESIMAGIAIRRMWKDIDEKYSSTSYNPDAVNNLLNNDTDNTNNTVDNAVDNTVDNTINSTSNTGENTSNVIVVTGNNDPNNILGSITGNSTSTTSTTSNASTLPKFPDGTTVISREEDIQNAIFETFGKKVNNLEQILEASWSTASDEDYSSYLLKLNNISRNDDIFNATFTVCKPSKDEINNGINLYGLQSYVIQATFQKNRYPEYSEYQLSTFKIEETKIPIAYHLTYNDGKYGIIDNNGIVILDPKYSKVLIPNSYIGLFACYTDENSDPILLNEKGIQQFKQYTSSEFIESTSDDGKLWIEQNVILVSQDGYYGIIDFDGDIVYDLEYDDIQPLKNQRGKLVLTKNGNKALGSINGEILSDFAYTRIGTLGIDFDPSTIVTTNRTENDVINMMATSEYIIGNRLDGTYSIIKTIDKATIPTPMSTLAKEYQMQIGNWQLALLDGVLPVYVSVTQ